MNVLLAIMSVFFSFTSCDSMPGELDPSSKYRLNINVKCFFH